MILNDIEKNFLLTITCNTSLNHYNVCLMLCLRTHFSRSIEDYNVVESVSLT